MEVGKSHFQNLFKESEYANIAEILKISSYFPNFIFEENNQMLMEEVSKEGLHISLASLKKKI
jgi:hypothetical protein